MSDDAVWDAADVRAAMDSFADAEQAVSESEVGAQRSAHELQSGSADLATAVAELNEVAHQVARLLDAESDGAASDYLQYAQAAEDHAVYINQSAALAAQATDHESAQQQVDYIHGEVDQVRSAAEGMEQRHAGAPDQVQRETSGLPERAGVVKQLCEVVKAQATALSEWWADVKWKREILAENRARHFEETVLVAEGELALGRMPDYSDPEAFYDDKERIQRWSEEDDATIAAARAARQREDM